MLPNTYQEIYDTHICIHALIFQKHVKMCVTTRLDRVFVDARAQTWQHVASMEDRCRQCLPPQGDPRALACSPTYDLGDLGILYEFWERSTVLLNLRINKDLELVLIHFLGVKNVRHLPCGFEFSGFKFPESSIFVYGGNK